MSRLNVKVGKSNLAEKSAAEKHSPCSEFVIAVSHFSTLFLPGIREGEGWS